MNPRTLTGAAAGGGAALTARRTAAEPPPPAGRKQALMKGGTQHDSSDDTLRQLAAFGVNHVCSRLPSPRLDEAWSAEGLKRLRVRIESQGIRLETGPVTLRRA